MEPRRVGFHFESQGSRTIECDDIRMSCRVDFLNRCPKSEKYVSGKRLYSESEFTETYLAPE